MTILQQVIPKWAPTRFHANSVRALFVLRLAAKLGDAPSVAHFADLARQHNDETLRLAYRRTRNHGHPPRDLGRRFHEELAKARGRESSNGRSGSSDDDNTFLAVKVERRSIAVAVFVGTRLDYHDVRHLSADSQKADASAINFLSWVIEEFGITSAALERMTNGNEIRRAGVNRAVLAVLRESVIPVWEISKRELLEGYAYPPLRSRAELRQTAQSILWPMFNSNTPSPQELDAAALGLYIQTERLFL